MKIHSEYKQFKDWDEMMKCKQELEKIGLVNANQIIDTMVLREQEAYPIYDAHYKEILKVVLDYLAQFSNLQLIGRNGMHRYNNMDIAMLSSFDAVDRVLKMEKQDSIRDENFAVKVKEASL